MRTAVIIVNTHGHSKADESPEIETCRDLIRKSVDTDVTIKRYTNSVLRELPAADPENDDDFDGSDELKSEIQTGNIDILVFDSIDEITELGTLFDSAEALLHLCFKNRVRVLTPEIELLCHDRTSKYSELNQAIAKKLANLVDERRRNHGEEIRSGMREAEKNSKWTGRPPAGFTINQQSRLRVDRQEFVEIYEALMEVESGESVSAAATDREVNRSTLHQIANDGDRAKIYLKGSNAENIDSRIESALATYENNYTPPYDK